MDNAQQSPQQTSTISISNWFWTLLAIAIPLVNIIFLLYWAFSRKANPSKRNYAIASLIWVVLWLAFYACLLIWAFHAPSALDTIKSATHTDQSSGVTL